MCLLWCAPSQASSAPLQTSWGAWLAAQCSRGAWRLSSFSSATSTLSSCPSSACEQHQRVPCASYHTSHPSKSAPIRALLWDPRYCLPVFVNSPTSHLSSFPPLYQSLLLPFSSPITLSPVPLSLSLCPSIYFLSLSLSLSVYPSFTPLPLPLPLPLSPSLPRSLSPSLSLSQIPQLQPVLRQCANRGVSTASASVPVGKGQVALQAMVTALCHMHASLTSPHLCILCTAACSFFPHTASW